MLSKTYKEVIRELRTHFRSFIGIEYQEPENEHEHESENEHESDSDDEDSKLFFKSCTNGDLDTVKTVLCKNIDVIYRYDRVKKDTGLHKAVKNNHLEVAKFLLINKADPEPYDIDTLTPIEFAVENNNPDMVKLILQYGDIDFNQCMEFCVYNRYSSIIEILACYQESGYDGLYAIKVACRLRYLDLVVLLLRCFLVYNNDEDIPKMVYSIGYMVITHFDYIYDCITIETLVSVCVLCCPKIAILFKKIEHTFIGRYSLKSFVNKCNKEIRMMSSILVCNKPLSYILSHYKYNNTTLVNQYKYILSISDKFVIYKDLIRSRMYTLLNEHS